MLDAAREDVCLQRPEFVRLALDDQSLHPLEDEAELLVRVAVERHGRARLEADQVQHRPFAEERLSRHALGELERADGVEANELRLHALDYRLLL